MLIKKMKRAEWTQTGTITMAKNINQVHQDLQNILNDVGEEEFMRAKALYLKDVDIVDAEGQPIDAEDVDVTITLEKPAEEEAADMEMEEEKQADEDDEEMEEKSYVKQADENESDSPKRRVRIGMSVGGARGGAGAGKPRTERGGRGRGRSMKNSEIREMVKKELRSQPTQKAVNVMSGQYRYGQLKHFRGEGAEESALRFGHWAAAMLGSKSSMNWCRDYGVITKAHTEGVNTAGGYLVPDEFSDQLISLREQYGVYRRNAHIEPMGSDTKRIPRRDSTLTAYFTGEASAITESTQGFSQVELVARKLAVLTTISNELQEDALINLGDTIAGEAAYAFANKEDEAGFNGDGTSTYGGITGLNSAIGSAGVVDCGSHSGVSDVVLQDLHDLMAKLPTWADTPNTKWYMHKSMYNAVIERIVYASGGVTGREISMGVEGTSAFGYPVEFSQVMTTSSAAGAASTLMYFGDLSLCGYFGDRRSTTIEFSNSALNAFEQDEIAVRSTERFDIVNTNVGDSSSAGGMLKLTL